MRKAVFARALTLVAALGLVLAFPVSAVADHAGEWIPYDAGDPAHASSIVDPTTVELAIEDPEEAPLGTSVEIADLDHEVESGTTLSFEHTTESGVGCNDSGKNDVRAFVIIDGENTNTWDTGTKCGGTVVIEEGGTITHAGVVMDADQPEPGVVRVSNLEIGEHLVHFTNPPELEVIDLAEPTAEDATCDESGTVTIPEVEGVAWILDNEDIEPSTVEVEPGDYSVATSAQEGYAFDEDVYPEGDPVFNLSVAAAEDCDEPTTEPSSEPTEDDSTDEPESTTTDDTTPASSQETLPDTGVSPLLLVGGGLALVLVGGAAMLRSRRTE